MSPKPRASKAQTAENSNPEDENPSAEEALPERSFRLIPNDDEETAVTRVSVGADPRVSIGAGETFATTDPRLADRLAAQPELEEVTR